METEFSIYGHGVTVRQALAWNTWTEIPGMDVSVRAIQGGDGSAIVIEVFRPNPREDDGE